MWRELSLTQKPAIVGEGRVPALRYTRRLYAAQRLGSAVL
jgi:hypothetical protein